jgi:DNA-binding beta-propeller fold protein YncE
MSDIRARKQGYLKAPFSGLLFSLLAALLLALVLFLGALQGEVQRDYDVYTYVTDFWKHSVVVIKNFQVIDSLPTSAVSTNSIDITPDLSRVYTTNNTGNSISCLVVDPASSQYRKEIAVIAVGMSPLSIRVHPDGSKAYAVAGRFVLVIDTDPESETYNTVVKRLERPRYLFDLDITPEGDRVFVVCEENGPGSLSVVDTLEDKWMDIDGKGGTSINIGQFIGGSPWYKALKIGSLGYGYILNTGKYDGGRNNGNTISVFDSATYEAIDVDDNATTTTPGEPDGVSLIQLPGIIPTALAFSPDGTRLYMSLRDTISDNSGPRGKLILIDTDSSSPTFNRVRKVVEAGFRPEGVGVWPDGRYILMSCRFERVVRVFDRSLRAVTTIPVNYPGAMVSVQRSRTTGRTGSR